MKRESKRVRRYSRTTLKQMAEGTGLSEEEVKENVQKLLKDKFMRRCYDDSGRLIPDLYELPVSLPETEEWRGVPREPPRSRAWLLIKAFLWCCLGLAVLGTTCTLLTR